MKFFLNPGNQVYLRGLAREFDVSTNTVRQELEKLSDSGVVTSELQQSKRLFRVNEQHPLFGSIRKLLLKHTGVDTLFEAVFERLGELSEVYLTGPLARGVDTPILDAIVVGQVDQEYLHFLVGRAEKLIGKKVRIAVYADEEWTPDLLKNMEHVKVLG